jgi:hypothetical protein
MQSTHETLRGRNFRAQPIFATSLTTSVSVLTLRCRHVTVSVRLHHIRMLISLTFHQDIYNTLGGTSILLAESCFEISYQSLLLFS